MQLSFFKDAFLIAEIAVSHVWAVSMLRWRSRMQEFDHGDIAIATLLPCEEWSTPLLLPSPVPLHSTGPRWVALEI